MLFVIQPELLINLIELITESPYSLKPSSSPLCLKAANNRVLVTLGRPVAGTDALVLMDGQCTLSGRKLVRALNLYRNELSIAVEADERHLCIGRTHVPVLSYSNLVPSQEDCQVFIASDLGFDSSIAVGAYSW